VIRDTFPRTTEKSVAEGEEQDKAVEAVTGKPDLVKQAQDLFGAQVTTTTWETALGEEWKVKAGTRLSICRADDPDRRWQAYVTRTDVYGRRVIGNLGCVGSAIMILINTKVEPGKKYSKMQQWLLLTTRNKVQRTDGRQTDEQ